jgi:hypothetical protein
MKMSEYPTHISSWYGKVCNGGNCDRKDSCIHALKDVMHNGNHIYSVGPGQKCLYYVEYHPNNDHIDKF